jgi:S-adenosylmethionine:tRNA ribosyltransferase-isomerase
LAAARSLCIEGIVFATITHAAAFRRPAIRSSIRCCRSTSRIAFRRDDEALRSACSREVARRGHRHDGRARARTFGSALRRGLAGDGVADQRIGARTRLRVVDAILSGTHEPGTSHYDLLRAFATIDAAPRGSALTRAVSARTSSAIPFLIFAANARTGRGASQSVYFALFARPRCGSRT